VRMYKILAADGNEYDSISAEKIEQWIRENRVELKTPVMPEGADDWVFLGDLPEFKENFAAAQKRKTKDSAKSGRRWPAIIFGLLLVLVVAGIIVLFILKKAKHP
jgi:hypothetical protein